MKLVIEGKVLEGLKADYTSPSSEKSKDGLIRLVLSGLKHYSNKTESKDRVEISINAVVGG